MSTVVGPGMPSGKDKWTFEAHVDGQRAGFIDVTYHPGDPKHATAPCFYVSSVSVEPAYQKKEGEPAHQRKWVGTRLYEAAAKFAATHNLPLCSGFSLTPSVRAFWEKQVGKGRANWVTLHWWGTEGGRYEMAFPPPPSLEGRVRGPKEWSPRGQVPGEPVWPEFVDAYLEAALWASVDEGGDPLDKEYSVGDFSEEAVKRAVQESNAFILENRKNLESVGDPPQHGHDFWLSRNGHGAGFFDRGYGKTGDRLQNNARAYGERYVYAGDDGKLYFE